MQVRDSLIVISGGAVRVGRAVALHLARQGAKIAFSYYLDSEPWQETLAEIQACGVEATATKTEMQDSTQVRAFINAAHERFGKIDVLINSASIWLKAPFMQISEQDWDLAMAVNLRGPFLAAQAAAEHMLAAGQGLIINLTDLSAFQTWPGYSHHAASKAGLVSLTHSMAVELAPQVRVNAIAPGTVLLPDNASPEKVQWAVDKSVLKRVGTPEYVARTVVFLMENEFTTGAVYFVDGGRALI